MKKNVINMVRAIILGICIITFIIDMVVIVLFSNIPYEFMALTAAAGVGLLFTIMLLLSDILNR